MKNYFMILLITGIFGSVASVLSDGTSLGKYVKYISALVCVILVITPLKGVFKSISIPFDSPKETVFSSNDLTLAAIKLTEEQISKKIEEKFGIIPTDISIDIDRDGKITLSASLKEEDEDIRPQIDEYIKSLCD
jgi:hypothetical protein